MNPILRLAAVTLPLLAIAACQQEGPAQQTGRSLDNAAARTRDAIEPPSGPVERAGRSIDRAVNPGPAERTGRTIDRATE